MRTGLHANDTKDHQKILDYYRRSGARTFKTLVFHDDLLQELRGMGVTIVGRVYTDRQKLSGTGSAEFIRKVVDSARRHPAVHFWEGYNEEFTGPELIGQYATVEIARMLALEDVGAKAAILCSSCGTPALPDDPDPRKRKSWEMFLPALEHAMERGHALALHEYAGPYMQNLCQTPDGRNQWNWATNQHTGVSANGIWDLNLEGYLTLRYRKVHRMVLQPAGLGGLPILITEGGIDDTTPRPGPPDSRGYKSYSGGTWARIPGIGDYADQRYWYMVQATHDDGRAGRPNVIGVVDFGWEGTATGWPDFDLSTDPAMVNRIIQLEQAIPAGAPWPHTPTPPAPTPPPTPTPAPGGQMDTRLADMLRAEFGDKFDDLRSVLPANPNGPSGNFGAMPANKVNGIAVHHTAGNPSRPWADIAREHIDARGFAGIGYHIGIQNGRVSYLGDIGTARAHVYGRNDTLPGVVVAGNFETDKPPPETAGLLTRVVSVLDRYYGKQHPVSGHGDLAISGHGTACPGQHLEPIVKAIRAGGTPPAPQVPDDGIDYRSVAYLLEAAVRTLQNEHKDASAAFIRDGYLKDALAKRRAKYGV